jgi:hypothetical protein
MFHSNHIMSVCFFQTQNVRHDQHKQDSSPKDLAELFGTFNIFHPSDVNFQYPSTVHKHVNIYQFMLLLTSLLGCGVTLASSCKTTSLLHCDSGCYSAGIGGSHISGGLSAQVGWSAGHFMLSLLMLLLLLIACLYALG